VIEGQPVDEGFHGDARVVAMANRAAAPVLGKYSFEPANGVITGFAGALLLQAIGRTIPVLCLVAQAHKDYPDARAAAKVIETVNPLVPLLVLDTKPLRAKAEEIETEVRRSLKQQEREMTALHAPEDSGPGEMYR
jgi:predicted ATP-grasp superfamily ATP-dependent carboligase